MNRLACKPLLLVATPFTEKPHRIVDIASCQATTDLVCCKDRTGESSLGRSNPAHSAKCCSLP